jgi:hypothetical protein
MENNFAKEIEKNESNYLCQRTPWQHEKSTIMTLEEITDLIKIAGQFKEVNT